MECRTVNCPCIPIPPSDEPQFSARSLRRTISTFLAVTALLCLISPASFAQGQGFTTAPFVDLGAQDTNCFLCQNPTIHPGDIINVNMAWSPGLTEFGPGSTDCGPFNFNWFVPGSCSGDIELSGDFGILSAPLPISGTCNISSGPFQFFNPPLFVTSYAQPGTYVITANVFACQPDPDFQHDVPSGILLASTTLTITVVPNVVPQFIQGQMLAPAGSPTAPILTTDPSAQTAHVPLGSTFQLTLEQQNPDGSLSQVPSSFSLDAANLARTLDPGALFPDNVVFGYQPDPGQPGTLALQAVHTGTQVLVISPQDGSPVTQVTISVEDPSALGGTHPEVDSLFIPLADYQGIPPQYVKGQVDQESTSAFNPTAYRYEPTSKWVGDYGSISRGRDYRSSTDPYFHYRLATQKDCIDPALVAGDALLPADISAAQIYNGCTTAGCSGATAWDLIQKNPEERKWKKSPNYALMVASFNNQDACGYLWTAQTDLAASYGYMQMTYVNTIDTLHWQGTDTGVMNPSALFDTPENLSVHGGSVGVGTDFLSKIAWEFDSQDFASPSLAGLSDFQNLFLPGWTRYNGCDQEKNPCTDSTYAESVLQKSQSYLPIASKNIFVGAQQ